MAPNRKIFALKRIRLSGRDSEAAAGFLDEITLLRRLAGRANIIQLVDSEVSRPRGGEEGLAKAVGQQRCGAGEGRRRSKASGGIVQRGGGCTLAGKEVRLQ